MCKEDVRIGRATGTNTGVVPCDGTALQQVFRNNPDRIALAVGYRDGFSSAGTSYCILRAGTKFNDPVIAVISGGQPSVVVTIEQLGLLIQGEVWGQGNDGTLPTAIVTEVFLLKDLKDV